MIDLLKKDMKIGDKVKLYLTTGKEPEGTILTIGENYVLLKTDADARQNRIFEKLIGGWEILESQEIIPPVGVEKVEPNSEKDEEQDVDKDFLLNQAILLRDSLKQPILSKFIEPNANIIEARSTTCLASNSEHHKILILNQRIADKELLSLLRTFEMGSIIPVVLAYTERKSKKKTKIIVNSVVLPDNVENYINKLIELLNRNEFSTAYNLLFILGKEIRRNKFLGNLIHEYKKEKKIESKKSPFSIEVIKPKNEDGKKAFKNVEKEINNLIRLSQFESALLEINKQLEETSIEDKYRSSLLLKKAQIYSSLDNPEASELAYLELIAFNERIKTPANNLSHLYTELGRLQALKVDKQTQALHSIKKALKYNPDNNYALNLYKQLEGKGINGTRLEHFRPSSEEHLIIEAEDDSTTISKMIDLDIKEHKYNHPEILKNDEKPTAFIAKSILDEAKKLRNVDLSERYPLYLEAAKAFSELNIGSYDLQDYYEAAAYYSMLKGNSLFITFRNRVVNQNIDYTKLTRLKDSACSYYIESLNLLSNIEPSLLLNLLANYLKLNIVLYHIQANSKTDVKQIFKGQFIEVFKNCIRSKNKDIEAIAYKAIVDCGASSTKAWNSLADQPGGTGFLYNDLYYPRRKKKIFDLINSFEGNEINSELKPGEFFKNTFLERRNGAKLFSNSISSILRIDIEPHNIHTLTNEWKEFVSFQKFLTPTDIEVKKEIDNFMEILHPYLSRGEKERTNILIQGSKIVENQINFINSNTTFYGRLFFYGLLNKWKKDIDLLLEEKITQSYPNLAVVIDPPYYIKTGNNYSVPIIIKNIGEATANGFIMEILCESIEFKDKKEFLYEVDIEIAATSNVQTSFDIPSYLLQDSKAVEIKLSIQAIYQRRKLTPTIFEFTVEEEPHSHLTYDDIPWRDGPIPPEQLFKGRKKLIRDLSQHYLSVEKDKPYILYGLTRTGKSSILEYLKKDISGNSFISKGKEFSVITFEWDLSEAASFKKASDFWRYILYQQTFEEIENEASKFSLDLSHLNIGENVRAKDFKILLEYLKLNNLYPVFLIDEFSFIKTLIDDGTINSAFLHTLRQFSLSGLASFIFAGTYDIKSLIKDPKYGITGQLVNAIEEQINEISDEAAEELIEVINDKLSFTPEATEHIKFLSGNVPYFIQIICKYCGYYASENNRRYIGYPELEKVVQILIGQTPSSQNSLVKKLPENTFQNNQFSPADPKEVAVLITSITYLNRNFIANPRPVGFYELQQLWADKQILGFRPMLAEAITLLKEKKILLQTEDEGIPVYSLAVDLFRRWWTNHNPDINLTLTMLTE